jgi:hypothetical protein
MGSSLTRKDAAEAHSVPADKADETHGCAWGMHQWQRCSLIIGARVAGMVQ